jgi:hypothetical protein
MKLFILLGLITSSSLFAGTQTCRSAVVDAKARLGETLAPDSFSSRKFESYNITVSEFNALSSQDQAEIYMQIKPLSVMVDEVIATLNRYIEHYSDGPYSLMYVDLLQELRGYKDDLFTCIKEKK